MENSRRLFVGGLFQGIVKKDLCERFSSFGKVNNIDIREKKDVEGNIVKTFAYIDLQGEEKDYKKCISVFNKSKWRGKELQLQQAKESFITKLKREQDNKDKDEDNMPKKKKKKLKLSVDKDVLIATTAPKVTKPDNYKWVRGKAGKLVPVLRVRKPGEKKLVKNDPAKHSQFIKKLDGGRNNDVKSVSVQNLTWNLEEKPCNSNMNSVFNTAESSDTDNDSTDSSDDKTKVRLLDEKLCQKTHLKNRMKQDTGSSSSSDSEVEVAANTIKIQAKRKKKLINEYKNSLHTKDNSKKNPEIINIIDSDIEKSLNDLDKKLTATSIKHSVITSSGDSGEDTDDLIQRHKTFKRQSNVTQISDQTIGSRQKVQKSNMLDDVVTFVSDTEDVPEIILSDDSSDGESVSHSLNSISSSEQNIECPIDILTPSEENSSNESDVVILSDSGQRDNQKGNDSESDVPDIESWVQRRMTVDKVKANQKERPYKEKVIDKLIDTTNKPKSSILETVTSAYNSDSDLNDQENNSRENKSKYCKQNMSKSKLLRTENELLEFDAGFADSERTDSSESEEDDILDSIASGSFNKKIKLLEENYPINKKSKESQHKLIRTINSTSKNKKSDTVTAKLQQKQVVNDLKSSEQSSKDTAVNSKLKHEASNKQRLESLRERQKQTNNQKTLIKKALSKVDCEEKSKRIVFDSDGDSTEEIQNNTLKKIENPKEVKEKIPEKPTLFESESSNDESDSASDVNRFQIKPQFEGKHGNKLMKLQSKFGNDERFKLDPRFTKSDSESSSVDEQNEDCKYKSEQQRSLEVLESVIGRKSKENTAKQFKDVNTLQYDPSREDHKQFELTMKEKPQKKAKKKKEKPGKDDMKEDVVPEVSKDKFFQVDPSFQDILKKGSTENTVAESDKVGEKPFSLLDMYGSSDVTDSNIKDNNFIASWTPLQPSGSELWQTNYDSSDDEEMKEKGKEIIEEIQLSNDVPSITETFFFTLDDPRIKEGVEFFCRTEQLDEIREKWEEKRPELIELYKLKRKRTLRKNKATHKFQASFKKKKFFQKKN